MIILTPISIADQANEIVLGPGDMLLLPVNCRRLEWMTRLSDGHCQIAGALTVDGFGN